MRGLPMREQSEFEHELYELVNDMISSYRDKLTLRLQQGYEDSSFRYVESVTEADVIVLQETDSLESETAEQFLSDFKELCELHDVELGDEYE
jgi:hypothetical protein